MINRLFSQVLSRRYAFTLFYAALVFVGWISFRELSVEQLPNSELPSITVNYSWGRTSPEVMEQEITRKVEQIASRLANVKEITSRSSEGISSITVTFQKSVNINLAQIEWTENLKVFDASLPLAIRRGEMTRSVPDEVKDLQSFISYSVSGPYSAFALKEMAEDNIQLPMSGLEGLAKIELNGVLDPVLTIKYKANKWNQLGLEISQIATDLSQRFKWQGAGIWQESGEEIAMLVKPMPELLDSIRAFPIQIGDTRWSTLGALSEIIIEDYPVKFLRRINGEQALTVEFVKESGADALQLADQIHENMSRIQSDFPKEIELRLEKDATEQIRNEISGLTEQAIFSVLFVFILLLVLIRRIRAPLLILSNILFSLLFAFFCLSMLNQTLNTFTMAALTISIGMLVDNAIVVYEHLEMRIRHDSPTLRKDIIREMIHILVPVIGNTLTTIGIFLPLLFTIPSLKYFLEPFGIALASALLGSILISMTWIPFLFQYLPNTQKITERKKWISTRFWLNYWKFRYKIRWAITIGMILLIGLPTYLIPDIERQRNVISQEVKKEKSWRLWLDEIKPTLNTYLGGIGARFYKSVSFGEPWKTPESESLVVSITAPVGTPLQELNKIAVTFEELAKPFQSYMRYSETYLNESFGAILRFEFDQEAVFTQEPYQLKGELMYLAARTGNSSISVAGFGNGFSNSGYAGNSDITLELSGYNYENLEETAVQLKTYLEKNPRVANVDINKTNSYWRDDLFHYVLSLDNQKLMQLGIQRAQLINELRSDISPDNFYGRITYKNNPMFIRAVNVDASERKDQFYDKLRWINGVWIRLSEIAKIEKDKTLSQINRKNQKYTRIITFEYRGNMFKKLDYPKKVISEFVTPIGIKLSKPDYWARFRNDKNEENINRWLVMVGAFFIVLMIIAALLNRWKPAFATLSFVFMGLVGMAWASMEFNLSFGRGAYAGVLLLCGVIVNNGILLYHEKLNWEKLGVYGLRNGIYVTSSKMRSIWLTTLTTVSGLLPLLIWSSDPFWSSMALVVCSGLLFSTSCISLLWGTFNYSN